MSFLCNVSFILPFTWYRVKYNKARMTHETWAEFHRLLDLNPFKIIFTAAQTERQTNRAALSRKSRQAVWLLCHDAAKARAGPHNAARCSSKNPVSMAVSHFEYLLNKWWNIAVHVNSLKLIRGENVKTPLR